MGLLDRIEAQFTRMEDGLREVDEVLSHFSGNLTDRIRAENHRGRQIADSFLKVFPAVVDDPHSAFLANIHAHLMRAACKLDKEFEHPERQWRMLIVDTESMLGCCLPGGYIILDRAIIDFAITSEASDQASLAFILAHESAHLLLTHTTNKLSRELGKRACLSLVSPSTIIAALASGVAYAIAMSMVDSSYSKREEFEADRLAVHILKHSRIDPRGGINLFRRLNEEYMDICDVPFLKYFARHPPNEERIKRMEEEVFTMNSPTRKRIYHTEEKDPTGGA